MRDAQTTLGGPALPLLETVFAHAPVGLAHWDSDLRFRAINPVLAAMNGLPAEAHLGRRAEEVLGALGQEVSEVLAQVVSSGRAVTDLVQTGETPALLGVRRRWQTSYHPVVDAGEVRGVVAIVEELTQREAAAVAAHRAATASAALDAVYAETPVGLAFWNRDLRFERVNQALARVSGHSVEAHLGRTVEELMGDHAVPPQALLEQVIATGRAVTDLPFETGEGEGARQWEVTCYPVDVDGELLGVGCVVREVTERRRGEVQRTELVRQSVTARAQAEAAQVRAEAAAEEAARERELAEAARRRSEFLSAAGAQMGASLDVAATMQAVVGAAVPTVADWCTLTLKRTGGGLETVAVAHADPEKVAIARKMIARHPPDPDAPAGAPSVIRTGRTEVVHDVPDELLAAVAADEEQLATLRQLGLRHYVVAPIRTPRGIVGAFGFVYSEESGRRPGAADVELVESLASRAALHLENARLYAESAHIAQTLQTSLLPDRLPEIPGMELVARYRAAGSENQVGGDFYDVFPSGDGIWTAVIGDVSGKGAEAAALTALARHSLHTAALLCDDATANLRTLNRAMLSRDGAGAHFVTLAYVRVCPSADGQRAVLTVASGGHPPALVCRADGTVEEVAGARGPLVGIFRDVEFTAAEVVLETGDLLLLYTDGIVELRGPDGVFGEELLRAGLARTAGLPAGDVLAAVARAAAEAQEGEARDDLALLALRVRP